ncbi:hypothetical protein PABG_03259 [Paracoccidioides brasiliensis Pb03]|nr:hypothetical protein PABG_03259 [Paracoccidioides brasiliensis Pb03]
MAVWEGFSPGVSSKFEREIRRQPWSNLARQYVCPSSSAANWCQEMNEEPPREKSHDNSDWAAGAEKRRGDWALLKRRREDEVEMKDGFKKRNGTVVYSRTQTTPDRADYVQAALEPQFDCGNSPSHRYKTHGPKSKQRPLARKQSSYFRWQLELLPLQACIVGIDTGTRQTQRADSNLRRSVP